MGSLDAFSESVLGSWIEIEGRMQIASVPIIYHLFISGPISVSVSALSGKEDDCGGGTPNVEIRYLILSVYGMEDAYHIIIITIHRSSFIVVDGHSSFMVIHHHSYPYDGIRDRRVVRMRKTGDM